MNACLVEADAAPGSCCAADLYDLDHDHDHDLARGRGRRPYRRSDAFRLVVGSDYVFSEHPSSCPSPAPALVPSPSPSIDSYPAVSRSSRSGLAMGTDVAGLLVCVSALSSLVSPVCLGRLCAEAGSRVRRSARGCYVPTSPSYRFAWPA